MIVLGVCPICGSKTEMYPHPFGIDDTTICKKDHCGPDSWCKITKAAYNIVTEIRVPVHKTAVFLKHFHNTKYTFVYDDGQRSAKKLLLYFPKLVYHDYSELAKFQKKMATYLLFS